MRKTIENIGKKVLDYIYDFDHEYDYENGCSEPENGVYEAPDASMSIHIDFMGHEITGSVSRKYVEVLFESDNYDNIEEAVNEYVENNLDREDWFVSVKEDIRDKTMDEFQRNGFADEQDYNRWRHAS